MRPLLLLSMTVLGLSACDSSSYGEGEITGAIGDGTFGNDVTIYHGTKHIVVVDRKMECLDMAWVSVNYFQDELTSKLPFVAAQFTFDGDTPEVGNFSLDGNASVTGWEVKNLDTSTNIIGERAREGLLVIDSVSEDAISGSFDVVYGDGNVAGTFTSAYCRNVR